MEKEVILCRGSYHQCIQSISLNGIDNQTRWHVVSRTSLKTKYKCCQRNCNCKAEIRAYEENEETTFQAVILGMHENHDIVLTKPLREHLVLTVAKAVTSNTKGIKEAVATEVKEQINPRVINRIKRLRIIDGAWESLWLKLPSFVEIINTEQNLAFMNAGKQFIFLTFPYTKKFVNSKAFLDVIFIDGTLCTDHCKTTLLAAVTVTSDRIILPLAVAVTTGETLENYMTFLQHLSRFMPDSMKLIFMADQHPSISSSINAVYPLSCFIPCAWHVLKHLRCPKVVFFALLRADNIKLYETRWKEFQEKYPDSANKVSSFIDSMAYAKNNKVKLGFITDSPIEAFNAAIKQYRSKEPLILLKYIFEWALGQRNKQLSLLTNNLYCKVAIQKEKIRKDESNDLAVNEQKDCSFRIIEFYRGKTNVVYIVRKEDGMLICDCSGYMRDGIPCRHEYAVAKRFGLEYMLRKFAEYNETKVIKEALEGNYNILNYNNLEEKNIDLPQVSRQPGRPKTLRSRGSNEFLFPHKSRRCSSCGKIGHDKRKCNLINSTAIDTDDRRIDVNPILIRKRKISDPSIVKALEDERVKRNRRKTMARKNK